jgi:competence protein ComEC
MKRRTKQLFGRILFLVLAITLSLYLKQYLAGEENTPDSSASNHSGILEVHFIDVGQGDAILIEEGNHAMLIDAGENNQGSVVTEYLNKNHIRKLDYVIGTHPHSDHIGGLDTVLYSFDVDKIILPSVSHSTKSYEDVLDAIEKNEQSITVAKVGDHYSLGAASFTIIAPNSDSYEELNNYSIVIKLSYKDTSFLLTGDAEKLSEDEMLHKGLDLSADVLKLGHHGSANASSAKYLDAVRPTYGIISVGKDNEYGHPHKSTLSELEARKIKLYRTDEQGSVIFTSDGKHISIYTQKHK